MELGGLATNQTALGKQPPWRPPTLSPISALRVAEDSDVQGQLPSESQIRTEQVDLDFNDEASWERNMDDLILRAAIWQTEHWVDRSTFLNINEDMRDTTAASKVVLLSFDRMREYRLSCIDGCRQLNANTGHLFSVQ